MASLGFPGIIPGNIVITSNKLLHKYDDFTLKHQDSYVANMYIYRARA